MPLSSVRMRHEGADLLTEQNAFLLNASIPVLALPCSYVGRPNNRKQLRVEPRGRSPSRTPKPHPCSENPANNVMRTERNRGIRVREAAIPGVERGLGFLSSVPSKIAAAIEACA